MDSAAIAYTATTVPTQFVDSDGRRLAYRDLGPRNAIPILLALRLRGTMDVWDPAFLDALARTHRVITFDYSGVGQSTGEPSYARTRMAKDMIDLANSLNIDKFVAGGWSLGGIGAQVVTKLNPERVIAAVLLGTTPPGKMRVGPQPVFFEHAGKADYDLEDEIVLFFHPGSEKSRAAAKASVERIASRTADRSPPLQADQANRMLAEAQDIDPFADDQGYRYFLRTTDIPHLVISGTKEIIFPIENWFDLIGDTKAVTLLALPDMGHGPQHEVPELCADLIASFIANR